MIDRVEQAHFDVLIVGAGLSGIGVAYHLQANCPSKTYAILEGRDTMGGTWDLFRYPGIRSDSDMYTLGYAFRPWTNPKAIADGASILDYVRDTAELYGIDQKIRYGHRVVRAEWSSEDARWTLEVRVASGETLHFTCGFLMTSTGYYDYDEGYSPDIEGKELFRGQIVHPQHWPSDLAYEGKRVVVIGSGATAVTLVPELAKRAAHVTMLQRSPTYVIAAPDVDRIADWLRARLPSMMAYAITRWKNVVFGIVTYALCKHFPGVMKKLMVAQAKKRVGPDVDVAHFTPTYNPWDQRVCLAPRGDIFDTLRSGRAQIVTDHIASFTEAGLRLRSGAELEADLIITATGLKLKFLGGIELVVDGRRIEPSETLTYKGMMCSDVPNLAIASGYTNASWTLKCDLTSEYVCRLLNYMDGHGYTQCCPRRSGPTVQEAPLFDFSSGYVLRAVAALPRRGLVAPWTLHQNYALDLMALRHAPLDDGTLQFSRR